MEQSKNLEAYYQKYTTPKTDTVTDSTNYTAISKIYMGDGYICPYCGVWVFYNEAHYCNDYYPVTTYHPLFPSVNKTEQAFKILKTLVNEKIIKEPTSFKQFCNLIEKIAKVV